MKVFIVLSLWISSSAFAAHPASNFIKNTLAKGQQILALKSEPARNTQMCGLIKNSLAMDYIGKSLLGDYTQIRTDQAGINLFLKEMPSMAVTKMMEFIGKNEDGGSVDVDTTVYQRAANTFEVGVTLHTSGGNAYSAKIIVFKFPKSYRVIDGEYFGFSALTYLARDVQKNLAAKYDINPNKPVSLYMKEQMSAANYIRCP